MAKKQKDSLRQTKASPDARRAIGAPHIGGAPHIEGAPPAIDALAIDALAIDAPAFRALVYQKAGLCYRELPWRQTQDPWAILVSEVMLQQTQAPRVLPKFELWMQRFPAPQDMARAPLQEVLSLWSGLGYNRRALALARAAAMIVEKHGGKVPDDEALLRELPGVGVYTARAVLAFAFNRPMVFLETNIRTVLLRHFFEGRDKVPDAELEPVARALVDSKEPARWYNALMDYGVELKKTEANHSRKSAAYRPQSPFKDSRRRIRGAILKTVLAGQGSEASLYAALAFSAERIGEAAQSLVAEGLLCCENGVYSVPPVTHTRVHSKQGEKK